jgi:hypothetical protein
MPRENISVETNVSTNKLFWGKIINEAQTFRDVKNWRTKKVKADWTLNSGALPPEPHSKVLVEVP